MDSNVEASALSEHQARNMNSAAAVDELFDQVNELYSAIQDEKDELEQVTTEIKEAEARIFAAFNEAAKVRVLAKSIEMLKLTCLNLDPSHHQCRSLRQREWQCGWHRR